MTQNLKTAKRVSLYVTRYSLSLLLPWTTIIIGLAVSLILLNHRDTIKQAENEARNYHRLNLHYRGWSARLGGVYAPSDKVAPNPYLTVSDRDVVTTGGKQLTLINPAYMTRMVFEDIRKSSPGAVISKLTSTKPLNPVNTPDEWERGALEAFERGEKRELSQVLSLNNKPYLRLISQFVTENSCLKCHAQQGYKEGDIRGAVSISIPLDTYYASETGMRNNVIAGFFVLWTLGSGGILLSSRKRFQYEEQLRQKEARFRTVCDWTQGWEYWISPAENIEYVSPACEEITGYAPQDFYSSRILTRQIVHPEDLLLFEEHLSVIDDCTRPPEKLEFRIIRKDGEVRWIHHECRSVTIDGNYMGRRVSNRDITEQKLAVEEQHRLEQQMLYAQKLESLGVLAGGIAHDFNNILMAIIGNADLALMRLNKESPAVENLHKIEQAAARAADLAKQMLAYSGKGKFVVEDLDLNHLLEEMLHILEVSISKKAILRLNLTRPLPLVEGDATQMRQIIMNLVINASEAIEDASGVISIATGFMDCDRGYLKDVWLDENIAEGLYVYLEIADTGCGMDSETMAKIFDPFFTTKFTGRGLGMAAVLGIVRGHKGAIKVYSEAHRGTTIKILLPASNQPAEIAIIGDTHQEDWKGNGTILLVDDEEFVRETGSEMLRELGFTVITANDGREAIEKYKSRPGIAFVILDLTMPNMDGEQCFQELRQIKPDVKVIMSSGFNEQEVIRKFLGKGLAGFIQKPYKLSALKNAVSRL